uniref:Nuclear pore complex protein NUP1 n=1 Tax=Oryza glumipatula TaxID=40148 RepID=A0A0D9ZE56_9ORYZ
MEPSPYGGVGGKIRRRPASRAAATPYERPPAAAAARRLAAAAAAAAAEAEDAYPPQGGGGGGGWVSRLVDPASRLIAGGAARLFSTVFRKRLDPAPAPAPPKSTPPGGDNEPNQGLPESTQTGSKPILEKGKNPTGASDNKALSEVEHLVEFDRLTDLLRARTVESDLSAPADNLDNKNEARNTMDGIGGSTSHGMAADHSIAADDPVCGASSPAELAKQYMNSRYSKENRPNSLRSQVLLKNKAEASNIAYDRRRPGGPFVQELSQFSNENSELPVNGYVTPGLHGRSAIYRMSCSPFFKGPSSSNDINMSPFSSSQTRANSLVSGGRQVLKRRGAELENELGSIGPIRRIRQKSNMMSTFRDARSSPRGNFLPSRTIGSDLTDGGSPIRDSPSSKRLLLGTCQSVEPAEARRNDEDGKISSDNVLAASPQSNKMAEKIFEQLNIIVPSPKEKLSLPQFAAGNASCSMSKQPVRQGNEPNGTSDPSSSQKFQPMDSVKHSLDPELNGSPSSKDNLRKDGSSKLLSHSFKDLGNKDIRSDNVALSSVAATTSSKPGFKMAVFEDLPEFDDDQEAPIPSKNSMGKTEVKTTDKKIDLKKEQKVEPILFKQKVESNSVQKAVSSPVSEKPIASALKDARPLGLFSPNDPENRATHDVPSDNNNGFKFPHVPSGTLLESSVSQVPLASNKDDKLISASSSIFGLKQSSTPDSEQTNTADVKTEARLGESVTKPTTLDITNLEGGNERERTEDVHKSSDKVLPSAPPFHFASAASTTASLSNGFSLPSSSKLSNVTPIDKPAVSLAPSTVSTTFAPSSTSPPVSSPIPAIPTFNFGSSTSMVAATKSDSTNTVAKPASSLLFGTGDAIAEAKSTAQDTANKASSNLSTTPISSNISSSPVTSSSAFSSIATFSSSTVAASNDGIASTTSASTAPFTFSSSGNNTFGFNSPAQPAGFSTSVDGSTTQPSATSTIFGASSSGSGSVAFGAGTASTGSGITSFGTGASSSGPSTVSFGLGASSSGTGALLFGAGASSSGTGALSFGAGAGTSSSGPGTVSFGAGTSSGPGTVSFGVTTSSSGSLFGNSPFGSGTTFSGPGSGFAFSSPSSSAGSSLTMASTSMFSTSSTASSSPAFSNPFGSSSSPPSMFTFGQSASSGGGFSFGAQSSPAFSSQAPVFSFTSASMNSSTPQPAFGMTNANTSFGMGSPGNDQMNVEDSMADDTNQAAPAPAPIFGSSPFGQPASSPAAPVFGAPAVPSAGVFQFGGQQGSMQQNAAFPPAGGSLEFQGGNFSLGSGGGGGDKSSRRVIKVKRNPKKR